MISLQRISLGWEEEMPIFSIGDQEPLLNIRVIRALSFSICIHLFFFFFIEIEKVPPPGKILSPVQVQLLIERIEAPYLNRQESFSSFLSEESSFSRFLPSLLSPSLLQEHFQHNLHHEKYGSPSSFLFEKKSLEPLIPSPSSSTHIPIYYSSLQIKANEGICYTLSSQEITRFLSSQFLTMHSLTHILIHTEILVDVQSGQAFWHNSHSSLEEGEKYISLVEALLKEMRFTRQGEEVLFRGTVDFLFTVDPQTFHPGKWLREFQLVKMQPALLSSPLERLHSDSF